MKRNWKEIPRDERRAQWAGLYVTMNGKGTIVMNRAAYERLGEPTAFNLLYDSANNSIGLQPTTKGMRNAYPAASPAVTAGKSSPPIAC